MEFVQKCSATNSFSFRCAYACNEYSAPSLAVNCVPKAVKMTERHMVCWVQVHSNRSGHISSYRAWRRQMRSAKPICHWFTKENGSAL